MMFGLYATVCSSPCSCINQLQFLWYHTRALTRSSPALCKHFALQCTRHSADPGKIASRETANLLCRSGSSTPEQQLAHLATLKVVLLLSLIYLKVQLASPKMVGSQKEFSRLAQALNQGDSTCQTNYLR